MRIEPFIAFRFLRARQKNKFVSLVAILAVGGIAVGVAALIVSLSIMNGFEKEVRSRIIGTTSHINIHSLRNDYIHDWKPLLHELQNRDDVVAAAPFIYAKMPIAYGGRFDGIMLRGIIPSMEREIGNPESTIIDGRWLSEEPDSTGLPCIVLGRYLAEGLGANPGDTVFIYSLSSPNVSRFTPQITRFKVNGVFETGMFDFDAVLAYTNLESAQRLLKIDEAVTGIELRIDNLYEAESAANRIEKDIGFPYYAISWIEMNKNLFTWMTLEKWGLFLLLTLIVTVAAFNIASTLIMVVLEKTSQIGILRALGATANRIRRIFLIQGLTVGILGTTLGVIIGFTLCFIQKQWAPISLPPDVYPIPSLPVDMQLLDFLAISFAAIGITLISSVYPAWRASKYSPIDAIRGASVKG